MRLRFKIDQGEALRRGIDAPTSVVSIEINPKELSQDDRDLLADRMDGIDVRQRIWIGGSNMSGVSTDHITANVATFEALMAAVRANEDKIKRIAQLRSPRKAS